MFTKSDIGCYLDNSLGAYSQSETVGALIRILREQDPNAASTFCLHWIQEVAHLLLTSDTAKDDIVDSLPHDISQLTALLNDCCDSDVEFEWEDCALCLVAIEEEE